MTNTLYSLLRTVHADLTQIVIPDLNALTKNGAAFAWDVDKKIAALNARLDQINSKLDQISMQVTGPETGNFNPETAVITETKRHE